MLKYIARRLLTVVPILLGLSVLLFVFIHVLPGDPAYAILGQRATAEQIALMHAYLGLDRPLLDQYVQYLGGILHGDLGASSVNNRPILQVFLQRFPATVELTAASLVFAAGAGIPLGRYSGRNAGTWRDALVTIVSLLGISIPIFVTGLSLQYVLAVDLGVLPASGRIDLRLNVPAVTNFMLIDTLLAGNLAAFVDAVRHLVLPAVSLGSIHMAVIARITRASYIEVANEDYVRTARAKGLTEKRVDDRHILRNAWLPVTTVIGLAVGGLLAGAVITETVFTWNGVGRYVVDAIKNHDYMVVQSSILIFALIFLVVNLIVDVVYAVLDPRIRYS